MSADTNPSPSAMMGISIVHATPEQEEVANLREGSEWHGPLMTANDYLDRERLLASSDLSRVARQKWVMVKPDDRTSLDFLASCETHRRPILFLRPGQSEPLRAVAYSICSVFVPPDKRKRGYASLMMTLLHQQLSSSGQVPFPALGSATTGQDGLTLPLDGREQDIDKVGGYGRDATASFLYSDIGDFYEAYDWKIIGARHVEWDVQPSDAQGAPSSAAPADAEWLTADQLVKIAQLDRQLLTRTFEEAANTISSQTYGQKILIAVDDPEARAWRWRIERDNYTAQFAKPQPASKPSRYGVILPPPVADGTQGPAYAAWTFDVGHSQLNLLRFHFETREQFVSLVRILKAEAARYGMQKVEAWNVDLGKLGITIDQPMQVKLWTGEKQSEFADRLAGGSLVERQKAHLPSVAWYGERSGGQEVEWLANEYGWYI